MHGTLVSPSAAAASPSSVWVAERPNPVPADGKDPAARAPPGRCRPAIARGATDGHASVTERDILSQSLASGLPPLGGYLLAQEMLSMLPHASSLPSVPESTSDNCGGQRPVRRSAGRGSDPRGALRGETLESVRWACRVRRALATAKAHTPRGPSDQPARGRWRDGHASRGYLTRSDDGAC